MYPISYALTRRMSVRMSGCVAWRQISQRLVRWRRRKLDERRRRYCFKEEYWPYLPQSGSRDLQIAVIGAMVEEKVASIGSLADQRSRLTDEGASAVVARARAQAAAALQEADEADARSLEAERRVVVADARAREAERRVVVAIAEAAGVRIQ
ncbi:hypothetical protein T492DRAFT_849160 [Pavlovales sp. CCMP2436]|nr:hypothetical protein T492DRAFT_849160 [Pavlovales sp. CCMP2436]